jgi:hypothetical protein
MSHAHALRPMPPLAFREWRGYTGVRRFRQSEHHFRGQQRVARGPLAPPGRAFGSSIRSRRGPHSASRRRQAMDAGVYLAFTFRSPGIHSTRCGAKTTSSRESTETTETTENRTDGGQEGPNGQTSPLDDGSRSLRPWRRISRAAPWARRRSVSPGIKGRALRAVALAS